MEELRKLIRDDVCLFVMGLGALGAGLFGAVNWNSHAAPTVPQKTILTSQEQYDMQVLEYNEKLANRGKDAVIPLAAAVPLTVCGVFGAVVAFGVVAHRHS